MDPYTRLNKREIYRNPWLCVEIHEIVHPTGTPGEHVLVVTAAACGILVVDGDEFILARQPRFGARNRVLEIVKGGAEDGEAALACAQRELREELGLDASSWQPLGMIHELPSVVAPPITLWVASGLRSGSTSQENVEQIEPERISIEDAYRAATDGRIDDAVTLAALLRYRLTSTTSP
jgi:8-oxo-dGTP pyrophosphatase MutT (NUDIX family)